MNKYIFLLAVISVSVSLQGQVVKECGTKPPLQKPVITDEMRRQVEAQRMQISAPYPIRVFIRVFADDDGTNLAAT